MTEDRAILYRVHCARYRAHWGEGFDVASLPWPKTPKEWRQTDHGAPWDTNVEMARWHLKLATQLRDEGLLPPLQPEQTGET